MGEREGESWRLFQRHSAALRATALAAIAELQRCADRIEAIEVALARTTPTAPRAPPG